jgi:hypothetical protein
LFVVFFGYELYGHLYVFVRDIMVRQDFLEIFEFIRSERMAIFAENLQRKKMECVVERMSFLGTVL